MANVILINERLSKAIVMGFYSRIFAPCKVDIR